MDNKDSVARRKYDAIVIGASAGGIRALLVLLSELPADFKLPIIVVVHMPERPESRLAEIFQHHLAVKVMMAEDKDYIVPGRVYFAGAGYHLSIEQNRSFSISCEEPVFYSRPAIDFLMSSAADVFGCALVGILLTGANQDGAAGMLKIHKRGGLTLVQEPTEAEVATMPQSALDLFKPDFVLPLQQIKQFILNMEIR